MLKIYMSVLNLCGLLCLSGLPCLSAWPALPALGTPTTPPAPAAESAPQCTLNLVQDKVIYMTWMKWLMVMYIKSVSRYADMIVREMHYHISNAAQGLNQYKQYSQHEQRSTNGGGQSHHIQ